MLGSDILKVLDTLHPNAPGRLEKGRQATSMKYCFVLFVCFYEPWKMHRFKYNTLIYFSGVI